MMKKLVFVSIILTTLAACGGSVDGPGGTGTTTGPGGTGTTTGPGGTGTTTGPVADPPLQPVRLSLRTQSPRWIISDGGAPDGVIVTDVNDASQFPLSIFDLNVKAPDFEAYSDGSTIRAVRGVTPSGEGTAYSLLFSTGPFDFDAVAERLSETTVPSSGSASFDGSYMALWLNVPDDDSAPVQLDAHLLGVAFLAADFDAQTIEGVISNRRTTGSGRFSNIFLEPADIVDGAFEGAASGGQLDNASPIRNGGYSGLFVGLNSPEVVGTLFIDHRNSSPPRIELGAFVASTTAAPAVP